MDVDLLWSFLTNVVLTPWGLGILGLCIGSFLNVVVHRLPLMLERGWWLESSEHLADAQELRRAGLSAGQADKLAAGAQA